MVQPVRSVGNVDIIQLSGRITHEMGAEARETIMSRLEVGKRNFLLHLEGVRWMETAAIGEMVLALKKVREKDGEIKVLKPSKMIMDVLFMTRLHTVFPVFNDERDAIQSFTP